ncbi:MAG: polyprenol monophosphomannose synthase [Phycisphaeraceae bacterium]|nr:polyprenol monophosphomannose synthase [Phycisphaeraceae bacterium]
MPSPPITPTDRPAASVIVPTYNEAAIIATLIRRLDDVRDRSGIDFELIIVDDDSPDGTAAAAHALEAPWVHVVDRRALRSLSGAVVDGFARARADVLVVMDADLTHPPEAVPDLIAAIRAGAPMAIGSRYVEGGTTDPRWPTWRRLASRAGSMLVRPIARTTDPLSGFLAVRRDVLAAAGTIRTRGFKIGLEIIVRARVRRIIDIPIHFVDRDRGTSKASAREAARFLLQVGRLYAVALGRIFATPRGPRADREPHA